MLSLSKKCASIILAVILMLGVASLAYAQDPATWYSFTPDRTFEDLNGIADVVGYTGCTASAGLGNNGWDIDYVGLKYDEGQNRLYVGISMHNQVIAGDIDNNGNPGTGAPCFSDPPPVGESHTDYPNLGPTTGDEGEAIDFVIDVDNDGTFDYIAGVSRFTDITGCAVAQYTGGQPPTSDPGTGYGSAVGTSTCTVTNNPSTGAPDFEFYISNFSGATGLLGKDVSLQPLNFGFAARAGMLDDGTGEDIYIVGAEPTAVTLSSFAARPSVGGSASPLWLGLVGLPVLAAGSLFWAKRRDS